ncbi:MAG: hypothetical protein LBD64_08390 [Odoribacteraceae bacterium]|jgi:hypothetical protein|nr:hypothetical protein [Odoribacteraceae bacterium]
MKTRYIYFVLPLLAGLLLAGCGDDDTTTKEETSGTGGEEQSRGIASITALVGDLETISRAGIHPENPTGSAFLARYEAGQGMTVRLDDETALFTYRQSRWFPEGSPLLFPAGKDTCALRVSVGKAGSVQDGTATGLLLADELVHEDARFTPDKHPTLTLNHAKALLEIDFGETILSGDVTIGQEVAYKIPNANRYHFLQEAGTSRVEIHCMYNYYAFTFEVDAAGLSSGNTFEANACYKAVIKMLPGGSRLALFSVSVGEWPESPSRGVASEGEFSLGVQGWEGEMTVLFTNDETMVVPLNGAGQATWTAQSPPRVIRGIKRDNVEILIGREERGMIQLLVNAAGEVQPRVSNGGSIVRVNTVAELYRAIGAYATALSSPVTVVQEADLDLMNEARVYANDFYANYDGGGYAIKNVNANFAGKSYVGGLFGTVHATVQNARVVSGSVSGSGRVGGIAGQVNATGQVINCSNAASVDATGAYSGGIAGYMNGGKLARTVNSGTITSSYGDQGGICGSATSSVLLLECRNAGDVICTYTSSQARVGGLVGHLPNTANMEITACYNEGLVKGTTYVGGLLGNAHIGKLTACYNAGRVESTLSGLQYCGGIVGRVYLTGSPSVIACYNSGQVVTAGTTYAGAFFGNDLAGITVRDGYFTGYPVSGLSQSAAGAKAFSATDWPVDNASIGWGVGTSGANGYYWKELGDHASSTYPRLYWE